MRPSETDSEQHSTAPSAQSRVLDIDAMLAECMLGALCDVPLPCQLMFKDLHGGAAGEPAGGPAGGPAGTESLAVHPGRDAKFELPQRGNVVLENERV